MAYPLLLTGTIDTRRFIGGKNQLAVKDLGERLSQYDSAIKKYITESVFDKIVFVETSNFNLDCTPYDLLAKQQHKQFEYLPFMGNDKMVKERGKSYGEAEAIEYAIHNSVLLSDESTIYKITGRVFLQNSKSIVKKFKKCKNEFISFSKLEPGRCVTYIFKFNKEDYLKYFIDSKQECNEDQGLDIETVFYNILTSNNIEQQPFNRYPRVSGIIGGLGIKYDKSAFGYFLRDILIKIGFFTVKPID